jgi:hypothetical protein
LKIDVATPESGATVLHYISKGNTIAAFKEYLLAKEETHQSVVLAKSKPHGRNFLHWAGW